MIVTTLVKYVCPAANWAANTAYVVGNRVGASTSNTFIYECITSGTSAASGGPTGTGADITDGTAHWKYIITKDYSSLNAGLAGMSGLNLGYTAAVTGSWAPSTGYALGAKRVNSTGDAYECITGGTSASSGGPTGTSQDITDGTVHWKHLPAYVLKFELYHGAQTVDATAAATGTGYVLDGVTNTACNADNHLEIFVPVAERHSGVLTAAKYIIQVSSGVPYTESEHYTMVTGLQCQIAAGAGIYAMAQASPGSVWDKCIAKTAYRFCYQLTGGTLKNSLMAGSPRSGVVLAADGGKAINCTVYGVTGASYFGIQNNSSTNTTTAIVNCVSSGNAGNDFQWTYVPTTVSNNASEDLTGDDQGTNSHTGIDPAAYFTDAANGNFSLTANATDLLAGGTATGAPTDDIIGTTRHPTPDIGAWERAAATTFIPGVMRHFSNLFGGGL